MIVLVAALPQEVAAVVRRYQMARRETDPPLYERAPGTPPFAAVVSGVGREAMARACRFAVQRQGPSLLLSVGFAGGLDPALAVGDAVIADGFVRAGDDHDPVRPSPAWIEAAEAAARAAGIRHRVGTFLESPVCLGTPESKAEARRITAAAAVEMESCTLAEFARELGIAFLGVRFISDAAADRLDLDPAAFVHADGRFAMAKTFRHLARRPARVLPALRLGRAARQCDRHLLAFVDAFLRVWPPA